MKRRQKKQTQTGTKVDQLHSIHAEFVHASTLQAGTAERTLSTFLISMMKFMLRI